MTLEELRVLRDIKDSINYYNGNDEYDTSYYDNAKANYESACVEYINMLIDNEVGEI